MFQRRPHIHATRSARRLAIAALVVAASLTVGACSDRVTRTPSTGGVSPAEDPAEAQAPATPLGPVARRLDSSLDGLVVAYAPVAARASFITAAHTLYVDAVAARSGAVTITDREATLTSEIGRTEVILRAARAALVRRDATGRPREVQRRMLDAIDARSQAVAALRRQLALAAKGMPGADGQAEAFDEAWNRSVRLAREALTLDQNLRSAVDAPPEREDAIR